MAKLECSLCIVGNDTRLSYSIYKKATPHNTCPKICSTNITRNDLNNKKLEGSENFRSGKPEPQLPIGSISHHKKRRHTQTNFQSQKSQQVCLCGKISPHKCTNSDKFPAVKRLAHQNRPFSGIFPPVNFTISPALLETNIRRRTFANDLSSIWLKFSTESLCILDKLGCTNVPREGDKSPCIFGRFSDRPPGPTGTCQTHKIGSRILVPTRMANQLSKVNFQTSETYRIPGNPLGPVARPEVSSREKDSKDPSTSPRSNFTFTPEPQGHSDPSRSPEFRELCCSLGTSLSSTATEVSKRNFERTTQKTLASSFRGTVGTSLVASELPESFAIENTSAVSFPHHRRVGPRLGSQTRQFGIDRGMELFREASSLQPKRVTDSHQSIRTSSNSESCKVLDIVANRQSHSRILPTKRRRHSFGSTHELDVQNISADGLISNIHKGLLSARNVQLRSRSSVETKTTSRVASSNQSHDDNIPEMGQTRDRSVCIPNSPCGTKICLPGSDGQPGNVSRRSESEVAVQNSLGIFSSMLNPESPIPPKRCNRDLLDCSAQMGQGFLASRSESQSPSSASHNLGPQQSPDRRNNPGTSSECGRNDTRSMEMWGWTRDLLNWSPDQRNLLKSGWRKSTLNTYKYAWTRWCKWTDENNVNVSNPSGSDLARYLSDLHQREGLSYNTILLNKSVVATFCNINNSGSLASHKLVQQVLKAISLKKPREQKPPIWDATILSKFLLQRSLSNLSLFDVLRQTATLLLLCSGRRIHDLTLLAVDSEHIFISEDSIVLWPTFGSKTDSAKHRQSGWRLLDSGLPLATNPCYWIKHLINIGQHRRVASNSSNLFITARGEPRPASRTILAGWVKSVLREAGIIASPGSIRAAVASRNWIDDFPLDRILSQGNWRSENTFQRFYRKEIIQPRISNDNNLSERFEAV